ncbi:MAG TPA: hypothetical protein VF846_07030 [Thermoanaerobaculia bacterium]|jgi:hypothetical protein
MPATSEIEQSATPAEATLSSSIATSPADALLSQAIATTLRAESGRAELFGRLLGEIAAYMQQFPQERPWTFEAFVGTDGSAIFRGQTGRSIVVDPLGTLWKARSYEDFDTEYAITPTTCTIASLTPRYEQMHAYSSAFVLTS